MELTGGLMERVHMFSGGALDVRGGRKTPVKSCICYCIFNAVSMTSSCIHVVLRVNLMIK